MNAGKIQYGRIALRKAKGSIIEKLAFELVIKLRIEQKRRGNRLVNNFSNVVLRMHKNHENPTRQ